MLRICLIISIAFLLFACNDGSYKSEAAIESSTLNDDYETEIEPPRTATPPPPPSSALGDQQMNGSANQAIPTDRKIIYTSDARIRVDSLEDAIARINRIVEVVGGFLSDQQMQDDTYRKSATITMRLPVNGFNKSIKQILEIGNFVESHSLSSVDVSAEWVDIESRLATKREVRARYVDILRKRASKVEDILAAEDKIRQITEEIEAKEARLRYLKDHVSMSTFTLSLYETQQVRTPPPTYTRHFGHEIMDAFSNGLYIIKGFFLGLLNIWPLLLMIFPGVFLYRRWRKR